MPYSIFFVNKPITILYFILGLVTLTIIAMVEIEFYRQDFLSPLVFRGLVYILSFPLFLFYFYILRDSGDLQIRGVKLSCLKRTMKIAFFSILTLIGGVTAIMAKFTLSYQSLALYNSIFSFVVCLFGLPFLEKCMIAKFVSEGVRNNISLHYLDLKSFYGEVREVFIRKLLS